MVYNFSHTGLINGFSENKKCLEKILGMSLNDRTDDTYTSYPIAAEALDRNEVISYIIKYFFIKTYDKINHSINPHPAKLKGLNQAKSI